MASARGIPSPRLLARLAAVCGVAELSAAPVGEGTPGRVWWLAVPDRAPEWVLKLGASPLEAAVLGALARARLPVPRVVAQLAMQLDDAAGAPAEGAVGGEDVAPIAGEDADAVEGEGAAPVPVQGEDEAPVGATAPALDEDADGARVPVEDADAGGGDGLAAASPGPAAEASPASSDRRPAHPGVGPPPTSEGEERPEGAGRNAEANHRRPVEDADKTLLPPVPAGGPRDAGLTALCMARLAGESLAATIRGGGAPPLQAWAEVFAQAHARGPTVVAEEALPAPSGPSCAEAAQAWMRQWSAALGPRPPVDVAPLLAHAMSELPGLGARADEGASEEARSLCHGDWTLGNTLAPRPAEGPVPDAAGPAGVAMVDWEAAHLGWAEEDAATAARDLCASGWSALAALQAGETLATAAAGPRTGVRLAFWLVAGATAALVDALAADGASPKAVPGFAAPARAAPAARGWASAFLGLVLSRVRMYGV